MLPEFDIISLHFVKKLITIFDENKENLREEKMENKELKLTDKINSINSNIDELFKSIVDEKGEEVILLNFKKITLVDKYYSIQNIIVPFNRYSKEEKNLIVENLIKLYNKFKISNVENQHDLNVKLNKKMKKMNNEESRKEIANIMIETSNKIKKDMEIIFASNGALINLDKLIYICENEIKYKDMKKTLKETMEKKANENLEKIELVKETMEKKANENLEKIELVKESMEKKVDERLKSFDGTIEEKVKLNMTYFKLFGNNKLFLLIILMFGVLIIYLK